MRAPMPTPDDVRTTAPTSATTPAASDAPTGDERPSDRREGSDRRSTAEMAARVTADRAPAQSSSAETFAQTEAPAPAKAQTAPAPTMVGAKIGDAAGAGAKIGAQATADAPSSSPLEAQVSRGVGAVLAQRGGSVVLRLSPATLGTLKVQMQMNGGSVSLDLEATTERAHRALTRELPALRASLESRGMQVERTSVHLAPPNAHGPNGSDASQQQRGAQQNDDGGQARDQRDERGHDERREHHRERDGRERPAFHSYAAHALGDDAGFTIGVNARA